MLVETLVICALTQVAPFYNCNSHWTIEIYDTVNLDVECGNTDSRYFVKACSYYTRHPALDFISQPKIKIGTSEYMDKWGQLPLEHEIRHLHCRCNWKGHG